MRGFKILLLAITYVFVGCVSNNQIDNELARMKSKPFVTDIKGVVIDHGEIIDSAKYEAGNLKLIIYSSSLSCGNCALKKINDWIDMINYSEKFDGELTFNFIFCPLKKDLKSFQLATIESEFDYPVLIDSLGEFERLNPHLPQNKAMHTFLLDEDNNVILVGNPLHNERIKEMFYEEVEKRL